ncbi:MAG: hypothetical protein JNN11_04740 [Candidatus Doudnabacteria bacterium]|nr:hypothetical protein [Candidatus Doudnabacteria bacterium]
MDPTKEELDLCVQALQEVFGHKSNEEPCFQVVQFERVGEEKFLCHFSLTDFAGDPLGPLHYILNWNARHRTERHKCWSYVHEDGDMSVYHLRPWKPNCQVKLDDVVEFLFFLASCYKDVAAKSAEV